MSWCLRPHHTTTIITVSFVHWRGRASFAALEVTFPSLHWNPLIRYLHSSCLYCDSVRDLGICAVRTEQLSSSPLTEFSRLAWQNPKFRIVFFFMSSMLTWKCNFHLEGNISQVLPAKERFIIWSPKRKCKFNSAIISWFLRHRFQGLQSQIETITFPSISHLALLMHHPYPTYQQPHKRLLSSLTLSGSSITSRILKRCYSIAVFFTDGLCYNYHCINHLGQ